MPDIILNGIFGMGIEPLELMLINAVFLALGIGGFGLYILRLK